MPKGRQLSESVNSDRDNPPTNLSIVHHLRSLQRLFLILVSHSAKTPADHAVQNWIARGQYLERAYIQENGCKSLMEAVCSDTEAGEAPKLCKAWL